MFQLDKNFLIELGLGAMPNDEKEAFLEHLYQKFQERLGSELTKDLTDEQLEDFDKLANDRAKAIEWLEAHCPNYQQVVKAEIDKLKQEINDKKDQILGFGG